MSYIKWRETFCEHIYVCVLEFLKFQNSKWSRKSKAVTKKLTLHHIACKKLPIPYANENWHVSQKNKCVFLIAEKFANPMLACKWRNGCEELMVLMKIIMITGPAISTLHFLRHPEKMIYVTSLVPKNSPFYYLCYLFYACVRLCLQMSGSAAAMGHAFPVMGSAFCLVSLIKEIQ